MSLEIGVLPSGHLRCLSSEDGGAGAESAGDARLAGAFARNPGEGLFALAARRDDAGLSPSLAYWRVFAAKYLAERCRLRPADPTQPESVGPLAEAEAASLLAGAPPMRGAEYLSPQVLGATWGGLDEWVRGQIQTHGGLAKFLEKAAPQWHQVGRVCFRLAENRSDPDYPFAFLATYAPEVSGQGQVRHQPLAMALQAYAGARNKKALIQLLSPVQRASELSPLIRELVDTGDLYHPLAWSPAHAYGFLREIPLYEQSGVIVRIPDWWRKRARPRVAVSIGSREPKAFGVETLLDFKLEVALGDEPLSKKELRDLMQAGDGLLLLKGQWVEVDRERLAEALAHWQKVESGIARGGVSFVEGMRLLAGAPTDLGDAGAEEQEREWSHVRPGRWLESRLEQLRAPEQLKAATPGKALKACLRHYQQTGVSWLWQLSQLGLGACLADDMGLGKTIQVIALLLVLSKQRRGRPSLLVLPASLLGNWKSELERFGPSLRSVFLHPSQAGRQEMERMASGGSKAIQGVDVVLTTYGMLLRQSWLLEQEWDLVVLDEAQAIKNPAARQSKAVKKLRAASRIALTGTPVENRLTDLWSLFDFLCPGLLGSATRYKAFVGSLSRRETDRYAPLRNLVQPYILRRLKTDRSILPDLPEKTEMRAYCGLAKVQGILYQKAVKDLATALEGLDGIQRRGLVLSYLLRFKQICNHPSQLLGDGAYTPGDSGKFARLAELCEEIASRQEKVLVFTQFREMTGPLAAFMRVQFGRPGLVLHGGTPVGQRKQLVDRFQSEDGPPFFILSLKAGGTGLNLTEASHVVHFDRWWNPAVESQATDRAYRIGQHRNILVHKFVCQGTIEEKIDALIEEKTALASDILEGSAETLLTEMDNAELLKLVSLDINKARV